MALAIGEGRPYVKRLWLSFAEPPLTQLSLEALAGMDLANLPVLRRHLRHVVLRCLIPLTEPRYCTFLVCCWCRPLPCRSHMPSAWFSTTERAFRWRELTRRIPLRMTCIRRYPQYVDAISPCPGRLRVQSRDGAAIA